MADETSRLSRLSWVADCYQAESIFSKDELTEEDICNLLDIYCRYVRYPRKLLPYIPEGVLEFVATELEARVRNQDYEPFKPARNIGRPQKASWSAIEDRAALLMELPRIEEGNDQVDFVKGTSGANSDDPAVVWESVARASLGPAFDDLDDKTIRKYRKQFVDRQTRESKGL